MEPLIDALRGMWLRVRSALRADAADEDIREELRFHVDMETRRLVREGHPPADARRAANVRFGGVERYRERTRDARGTRMVEDFMGDVKYGLRMLAKNPVFTGVAILTLALGIGATTAIYTVVEAILLEPLPFEDSDELVQLYAENPAENQIKYMVSPMDFDDWRNQNRTFASMAGYWPTSGTVTENDGNPTRVQVVFTTEDYFEVMGASMLLGRGFGPDDGPGSTSVAVLSHGFWQRRFGGDPSVVGRPITLDGEPIEVIGVLRPEHTYPVGTDLWRNINWPMQIQSRYARWMSAVGRLPDPDAIEGARADLAGVAARIAEENPRSNEGWTTRVEFLQDELVGDTGSALWVLLAATGLVLLIACANVANLLLSRSEARSREIAVRTAFGAGRARLVRQLLTESLLLSGAGALVGLGLAWLGVRGLLALAPVEIPRVEAVSMDGTVLLLVLGVSLLTGLLFGLAPIVRLLGSNVHHTIRDGARATGSAAGARLQNVFVVGQLALALMLVAGAGLLVRSFQNLRSVDTGFETGGVLTLQVDVPLSVAPSDTAVIQFYEQYRNRLAELPGVVSVGDASSLPLDADHDYILGFRTDRGELPPDVETQAAFRPVAPGFFETLRTPILEGRAFESTDRLGSAGVAVVNESWVRRFFPESSPLGVRFLGIANRMGPLGAINIQDAEIVGVVQDVKYDGLRAAAVPTIYVSGLQSSLKRRSLVVRTSNAPLTLVPAARRELEALSPQVALTDIRTMDEVMSRAQARDRFSTLLLTLFGVVALLLASIGVYGVLAYAVAQRVTEVGIRMALGADRGRVRGMVLKDGLRLVVVGLALGMVGAVALSGVLASQLYAVEPRDPGVLAAVAGVLMAAGLLASLVPAWRATRVDPVIAMRGE